MTSDKITTTDGNGDICEASSYTLLNVPTERDAELLHTVLSEQADVWDRKAMTKEAHGRDSDREYTISTLLYELSAQIKNDKPTSEQLDSGVF